jgi:DNA-binding beta-propeller fold protein YncE
MRLCALGRTGAVWLLAGAAVMAQVAPIPRSEALPGWPFSIRHQWVIGGTGNWSYLTLDPGARQLLIPHQSQVQVVDIETGAVAGNVSGFAEALDVALNPDGETGYVSDGHANKVFFFDRRTFRVTSSVDLPASPRSLVFEPSTGLLFAFGGMPTPAPPVRNPSEAPERREAEPCSAYGRDWPPPPPYQSLVSIIDPEKKTRIADVMVCGVLGAAEADGQGGVYFTLTNFNAVGRLNASSIAELARSGKAADLRSVHGSIARDGTLLLDFKIASVLGAGPHLRIFPLGNDCQDARALAVDAADQRLFAGCANQVLKVVRTDTGASVAALTIGPGVDAVAWDPARGLIFTANGGGYGSLTVVRRSLSDSYAVTQNLPTLEQARTMALDPSTGLVYLVTTLYGANLSHPPMNGIGTLRMDPVAGSFQVLVIGN